MPRPVVPILRSPARSLPRPVDDAVGGQDQRRVPRPAAGSPASPDAHAAQTVDLVQQRPRIDHHAVADHRELARRTMPDAAATACRPGRRTINVWPALSGLPGSGRPRRSRLDSQSNDSFLPFALGVAPLGVTTTVTLAMAVTLLVGMAAGDPAASVDGAAEAPGGRRLKRPEVPSDRSVRCRRPRQRRMQPKAPRLRRGVGRRASSPRDRGPSLRRAAGAPAAAGVPAGTKTRAAAAAAGGPGGAPARCP